MQTNGTSGGGFAVEVRQNYENVVIESIARPRPFFFLACARLWVSNRRKLNDTSPNYFLYVLIHYKGKSQIYCAAILVSTF
jgi:hypothetical protein